MNDKKLKSLIEHLNKLKIKASEEVPAKHRSHPETYKAFLRKEITSTEKAIDAGRLNK